MKFKLRKIAAATVLFTIMAAAIISVHLLISDKNGAYANDGRTVLSNEEQLFPQVDTPEFTGTYATEQEQYLYSRLGLEKDGENVLDITRGKTEKHKSVIVVIDSGVKYDHTEFLDENGNTRISERSYSVATKTTVKQSGWDILNDVEVKNVNGAVISSYHGTQVCGSIFASHTNDTGFYGLADEAELVFVKIPFRSGAYSSEDLIAALEYAISIKPDVVNLSMGNYGISNYFVSSLRRLKNQGTVVITAAGNSPRSDAHYPSADSNAVGVGAFGNLKNVTNKNYPIATYSSFGDKNVDICAPGLFWQTYTNGDGEVLYTLSNGTSVAAPVVSAAVALYRSLYPEATPDEIIEKLYSSATDQGDLGKDYYFGYGGLDIYEFLFGSVGEVTFDYNNGTSATLPITEGVALKEYPFPSDSFMGKTFGGWYLDRECTNSVNYYAEVLPSGSTVYAKWTEGETQGIYDYTLDTNGNAVIKGYFGNSERIIIPSLITIDGRTRAVKTIAARAFQSCGAKKIIIPKGVTRLDEYSLSSNNLAFVWVPSTVVSVRLYAFSGTRATMYLQGEDVTGNTSYYWVSSYTSATWAHGATLNIVARSGDYSYENGVETIGDKLLCYDGDGELNSDAKYVVDNAVKDNKNLKKAVLPNVTDIGASAFEGCTSLMSVEFPCVEKIGTRSFYGCKGLTDLIFPASLNEISSNAFENCVSLTELDLSECSALTQISPVAFSGCAKLKIVDLQGATSLKSLGSEAFKGCSSLFIVSLPDGLNGIGSSAFAQCNSLTALKIPFTGIAPSNSQYMHLGIIFGASSAESQASFVPSSLKYVYVTGSGNLNSSALRGLSGITVFANGSFNGETNCTVYTQGNFSLIEIYAQGKLCGLYGGTPSSAIDADAFNSAYTLPQGFAAVQNVPSNLPEEAGVTALELSALQSGSVTVKFFNYDGELISETQYNYGEEIVIPAIPEKPSTAQYQYVFTGWDKQLTKAVADVDYTAQFIEALRSYEITFVDADGRVMKAQLMQYGATPVAPKVADKEIDETYFNKFSGWDKEVAQVTEHTVYTAQYTQTFVEYVITFVYADNNVKFAEQKYHYGDTIIPPETARADDNIFSYTFSKWSAEFDTVTGNAQYSAEYDKDYIEYKITFKDYNGTVLSEETYHYGETPRTPENPVRPSDEEYDYTFTGWDKPVTAVNGDTEYIAQYSSRSNHTFVIKFIVDNSVISTATYERGEKITIPADPEKKVSVTTYYYVFEGWTPEVSETAVADAEYTAVFARMVNIKFLDYDGTVISEQAYRHNSDITVPADPVRKAEDDICKYVFEGWNKLVSTKASASAEYTAVYSEVQHNFEESGHKAATCTEDGFTSYTCSECSKTYSDSIPAKGHTPSDWIVDKEASEEEEGHKYKECTVCHTVLEEETIEKLPIKQPPDDDPNKDHPDDPPEGGCNGCNSAFGGNIIMTLVCLAVFGLITAIRRITRRKT